MESTSRMQGTQVEKKKLMSVGRPLRSAELTALPARSLRANGGRSVTGGYGEAQVAPRSITVKVTAEPSTARSTSACAPAFSMADLKAPKSTALHARSR